MKIVWGMYFDETSRDELRSSSMGTEAGISARPRIRHPRSRSPVRSIMVLLRFEARRPNQRQLARRTLQPENRGTKAMQPPTITETEHPLSRGGKVTDVNGGEDLDSGGAYKKAANEGKRVRTFNTEIEIKRAFNNRY